MDRLFLKSSFEDFFQRELAHIGMQPVWTGEVFSGPSLNVQKTAFGYQDAYDEYRHLVSHASGEFAGGGSKRNWMFARDFAAAPSLNEDFIKCVPTELPFADSEVDNLQIMIHHSLRARRIVPKSGVPKGV